MQYKIKKRAEEHGITVYLTNPNPKGIDEIGLSKTYSFNYFGGLWVCRLNKEDTDKIKKKLKDNKVANCLLEFELKRKDSNDIENISKQVGMYKSQGY